MTKQNRKSARKNSSQKGNQTGKPRAETVGLRIIGGRFRRRKLLYSGEIRTRPMKDRLREAVFNLIGDEIEGSHAIDLFAGTGALGLEALSRGAARATLIEQHYPTADIIRQNVSALGVQSQTEIVPGNVFIWNKRRGDLGKASWLVFCSPPYDFYVSRSGEMLELLGGLIQAAPVKSIFVVEADERFDYALLKDPQAWDVRSYPPAFIGVYRKVGNR
ncbi:MAG: RsmD family RNA methyltransferase [Thermoguttaceae bacterium]|jgi:16S rRNA (guanine(966)-N(2))-methyltransferase RsmD